MSYRTDLEQRVRDSYRLICDYEDILRLSSDPKEQARAQHTIEEQWTLIKHYLKEYIQIYRRLNVDIAEDLIEIAAHFPDLTAHFTQPTPDNLNATKSIEITKSSKKKDFFISYNKVDKQWAEWIAWHLEEAGYSIIIQAWDFRAGGNFVAYMQRATTETERIIAVLSPDYLDSRFTQPEWYAAFAQDPTGEKGLLIPVRVRECEPKGLLPQIVYIDLVGLDEEKAKKELLTGVKRDRAKPVNAPGFPAMTHSGISEQPDFPSAKPSS